MLEGWRCGDVRDHDGRRAPAERASQCGGHVWPWHQCKQPRIVRDSSGEVNFENNNVSRARELFVTDTRGAHGIQQVVVRCGLKNDGRNTTIERILDTLLVSGVGDECDADIGSKPSECIDLSSAHVGEYLDNEIRT